MKHFIYLHSDCLWNYYVLVVLTLTNKPGISNMYAVLVQSTELKHYAVTGVEVNFRLT